MGGCRCTFRDCANSSIVSPGMHFFHFPVRDIERCEKWAYYSNNMAYLKLPMSQLRNKVVCETHFRDSCFMNTNKDRLTKMAVPTLMPIADGQCIDYEVDDAKKTIYDAQGVLNKIPTESKFLILNDNLKYSADKQKKDFEFHIDNSLIIEKLDGDADGDDEDDGVEIILPSSPSNLTDENNMSIADISPTQISHDMGVVNTDQDSINLKVLPLKRKSSVESNNLILTKINLPRKKKKLITSHCIETKNNQLIIDKESTSLGSSEHLSQRASTKIIMDENNLNYTDDYTEIILEPANIECNQEDDRQKSLTPSIVDHRDDVDVQQLFEIHKKVLAEHENSMRNIESSIKSDVIDAVQKEINLLNTTTTQLLEKLTNFEQKTSSNQVSHQCCSTASVTVADAKPIFIDRSPAMNKVHLFNGIKKYLNPSMVAILRMEMFGGPERKYKPDEKLFAMELFKLNGAYEYMRDEWRFRLPSRSDIETWLKEREDFGCEVEWDEC